MGGAAAGKSASMPPWGKTLRQDDLTAVNAELEAAGAWVFAGGLHPPSTAPVLRADGPGVVITDGPVAEGQGKPGGGPTNQGSPPGAPRETYAARAASRAARARYARNP